MIDLHPRKQKEYSEGGVLNMQNGAMGHEQGLSSTANYTLPGIMQYLQSQFTQVERNRLQGELERSSLKLKIIELENERNSLLRKTARLQLTVDQLTEELNELRDTKTKDAKKSAATTTAATNAEKIKADSEVEQVLGGIHSLDVSKLIHARKFLKSATNEILYLLKTPTVELENTTSVGSITGLSSLTGGDNDNDLFFNNNTLNNMNHPNLTTNGNVHADMSNKSNFNNNDSFDKPNIEKELNDILAAPFKSTGGSNIVESDAETIIEEPLDEKKSHSKKANGVSTKNANNNENDGHIDDEDEDEDDDDDFDDDFDDDDFDDDDDDDYEDEDETAGIDRQHQLAENGEGKTNLSRRRKSLGSQHGKNQKEKLLSLLKKSPKKTHDHSTQTLSVKLHPNLSEMELKSGRLFTYYDKANIVKIYEDLLGKGNLVKEVQLQDANSIVDIITNENFIVIATTTSLIAYTINSKSDLKIVKTQVDAKSIDLDKNKILLVSNDHIDVLEIDLAGETFKQLSSIEYQYEGTLKKAKFVKNNPSFDVAVLSSTNLYLYNTENMETQSKLFKSIPLNQYHEWLVTSRNMILRFNQGLYLFDFSECSEFKQVPFPPLQDSENSSDSFSEVISPCVDDDTMFYVTRCISSTAPNKTAGMFELRLFKANDTGDILEIKNLTNMSGSECYCVGKIGDEFSICVARGKEIHLYNITN